jgi:CheY-like chemotaxis protein
VLKSHQSHVRRFEEPCCFAESKAPLVTRRHSPGILVVDDDAAVRFLLDVGLQQYGFAVWQAGDGQEAVEVYQQERSEIDLVLLDVRMPRLDGPQTLAALLRLNPQICCCFMTGHAGSYTHDGLRQLGAALVIPKPFQLAELAQILAKLVGHTLPASAKPVS